MDHDENHIISAVEIEFNDKANASFLRQKVEEGLSEDERAALKSTVEESRITISGPEILLRRVATALGKLGENE